MFFNLVRQICIIEDNKVIYCTNNFFDNNLEKYTSIPKIVDFIKYINRNEKRIDETTEIYELIKDIYRSVS